MTPKQAELAKRAIQEANRLMAPVRERAKTLEARPDRVTLPGVPHNALLGRDEVSKFLGMTSKSVSQIPTSKLPRTAGRMRGSVSTKKEYRAADVGAYLLRLRVRDLWVVDRRDGTRQSLSESLFIAFRNFFHEGRGTNPLLVEPVTEETVNDFLRGRKNAGHIVARSAFEHFELKDGEGQFFRLHSHQFRHWVTTKAAAPVSLTK
jgi:hypothetical protein